MTEPTRERDRNGLEVLTRQECFSLMATKSIGRIAITSNALPSILPVNFVVDGESVVIQTAPGGKLEAATRRAVVAFEVDGVDEATHAGWSVVVTGEAVEIGDDDLDRVRALPLRPWGASGDHYIRIVAQLVSGRRHPGWHTRPGPPGPPD